jgi:hypothetical protein
MNSTPKRLLALCAILAAGFGTTFLLPEVSPMRPSRLKSQMPETLGDWDSRKIPITGRELDVLADDTSFERRIYSSFSDLSVPQIEASIVFSGKDMSTSIHRPEVCLRTQGWNFVRERFVTLPQMTADGQPMTVREIICSKNRRDPEAGTPVVLPNGKFLVDWQILYYTFIGATDATASHYGRTFIDIRDRVLGGFDQQWAYATFSSVIPGRYADQGVDIGTFDPLDENQTGKHLETFMRQLMPTVLQPPRNEQIR